jgi:hypothetical protein
VAAAACTNTPLRQMPPGLPLASPTVPRDATNAGRVQSIAVSPTDANRSIIAMQFGGLWRTFNNGATWFRVYTLPTVFVTDVEFGSEQQLTVRHPSGPVKLLQRFPDYLIKTKSFLG